ncbi:MAG: hypothetical protein NVSMB46_07960 [Candidatus Saccharimonadales bacterium]
MKRVLLELPTEHQVMDPVEDYLRMGFHTMGSPDKAELQRISHRLHDRSIPQSELKRNLIGGWVDFELGDITEKENRLAETYTHTISAREKWFSILVHEKNLRAHETIDISRNIALADVKLGIALKDREFLQIAIPKTRKYLGDLALRTFDLFTHMNDNKTDLALDKKKTTIGLAHELLFASLVLSTFEVESPVSLIPYIASPRQERPHVDHFVDGQKKRVARDYNVAYYTQEWQRKHTTPVQIKSHFKESYEEDYDLDCVKLVFGDADMSTHSANDGIVLSQELAKNEEGQFSQKIKLAQANLSYVLEG